jgi:hypothetical protein
MEQLNWYRILEKASESLKSEGRYNQASILKDAADAFAALKLERDGFKSIVEETMEALERHELRRTLEAVKKDYGDVLAGKYEGKGD